MSTFISHQEPSRRRRGGYLIENLKIRPKDCPVVVFGVDFIIFIPLWGSRGTGPPGRGFAASEQRDFSGYSFGHKRVPPAAASAMKDKRQLAARLKSLQSALADSSPCFKGSLFSTPTNNSPLDCLTPAPSLRSFLALRGCLSAPVKRCFLKVPINLFIKTN